jgi:acyl carrier protein
MSIAVINPSAEELHERFAAVVAASLRIDPVRVAPAATLGDLGAESIDLVEITLDVENVFSIVMPERSILDAARDVLGPGTVARDGRLTEVGSALLRRRLPEVDAARLAPGALVADVNREFLRVDVWERLIAGIVARSPRTCGTCSVALVQGSPGQVTCPRCGAIHVLPTGDELAREWVGAVKDDLGSAAADA